MRWEALQQGTFIAASAFVFAALVTALAPRAGMGRSDAFALFGLSAVSGVVGARLFWWGAQWLTATPPSFAQLYELSGGFASVGALAGCGLAFGVVSFSDSSERRARVLDLFVPSGLVALAIARLGCMARGCDFGVASTGPLAVVYSQPETPAVAMLVARGEIAGGASASLAPLGVYLAASGALAAATALILPKRWRRPGARAIAALIVYAVARLFVEEYRHPATAPIFWRLNANQWGMIVVIVVVCWVMGLHRERRRA